MRRRRKHPARDPSRDRKGAVPHATPSRDRKGAVLYFGGNGPLPHGRGSDFSCGSDFGGGSGLGRVLVATIICVLVALAAPAVVVAQRADHQDVDPLERLVGIDWSDSPLGESLDQLARAHGAAIWLDRRVDPGQPVRLSVREVPLRDLLARVAGSLRLGACQVGSVVYLGPLEPVRRLRTLVELRRQEARNLPRPARQRLFRSEPMAWEALATPRELLARLAEENQLDIEGLDRVAHDLWPARSLPPLPLVDRLTLILVSLDLTYDLEDRGERIRLVPIPGRVAIRRVYSLGFRPEDSGLSPATVAERWRRVVPESRVAAEGDRVVVEGPLEDHERLADRRPAVEDHSRTATELPAANIEKLRIERVRFVDQPLAPVVRRLATQLNLELRFDVEALRRLGIDVDRRVSVELEDVTVDALLRAVLEPAGLTFRRDGRVVEIRPVEAIRPN